MTTIGIKLLPAILTKFNVCHGDKLFLTCFFPLVIKSNILRAFHNLKRKFSKSSPAIFVKKVV